MADAKISALPAATTPLAGTEVIPIVQSSTTKKVVSDDLTVKNVRSNATTGILQVAGPAAGTTRVMTTPDANFTAARTDASQTFVSPQTVASGDAQFNLKRNTNVIAAGALNYTNNVDAVSWQIGTNQAIGQGFEINQGNQTNNRLYINPTTYDVRVTSGNLVIGTAGKGIDFSANTNATGMTSELLNWYEEGAFTPTVRGTTTVGTATYATQSGTYTRIGRMVYFQLELSWSGGTGAGQLRLGGLPFTCGNSNCAVSIGDVENVALTASYYMAGAYVFANSTQISLRECQVGGGGNNPVNYDDAGTIRVGGCYYV